MGGKKLDIMWQVARSRHVGLVLATTIRVPVRKNGAIGVPNRDMRWLIASQKTTVGSVGNGDIPRPLSVSGRYIIWA